MAEPWMGAVPQGNAPSRAASSAKPGPSPGGQGRGADNERAATLRQLAGRAYQLRASTRAADHFLTSGLGDDRKTGSWLVSTALSLADGLAEDLDLMVRGLKESGSDASLVTALEKMRVQTHQVHASVRGAEHFIVVDTGEDRETGSWLIATALGLAQGLANELDDLASSLKRSANDGVIDVMPPGGGRRATG
jgi:hypothetical protein